MPSNKVRPPYAIADLVAQPGSTASGYCDAPIPNAKVQIPIVIKHGYESGPVLVVTAGIHGGEYVPIVAVREFVAALDPSTLRGTVVAVLQASPDSFAARSAFVNPLDGVNINRSFPGDSEGTPTEQLAAWLWGNVISRADYYVDCHGGDLPEHLESFAGLHPSGVAEIDSLSRALADCFDVERAILTSTIGSTIQAAADARIPTVLIEVGGEGRWSESEVAIVREGLREVTTQIHISSASRPSGLRQLPTYSVEAAVLADQAGSWLPQLRPGTPVLSDDLIGQVQDPFGTVIQEVRSPIDGVFIYGLSSLAATSGDLLATIARPVDAKDRG